MSGTQNISAGRSPSNPHRFLFICGLHRSGTSLLHNILREHPEISGFANTGAPEDEGQHLQTVYPTGRASGGPGKFCFDAAAHLTETSPLITDANRTKLLAEWSRFWSMDKPILLEKSPPNIIRSRFLQGMFPNCYFIFIVRHPIAVSLATQKWSHTSIPELLQHWQKAHEIMESDLPHISNKTVITYEDLVQHPEERIQALYHFLNIPDKAINDATNIQDGINAQYFDTWEREYSSTPTPDSLAAMCQKYGYSFVKPYYTPARF